MLKEERGKESASKGAVGEYQLGKDALGFGKRRNSLLGRGGGKTGQERRKDGKKRDSNCG